MMSGVRPRVMRHLGVATLAIVAGEPAQRAGDLASRRLSLAIIGLLALAVAISIVTVVFWRMTRPTLDAEPEPAMRWSGPAGVPDPSGSGAPTAPAATGQALPARSPFASAPNPAAPRPTLPAGGESAAR
jgi:hypothetical protein